MRTAELAGRLDATPAMTLRALRQTAAHHDYAVVPGEALYALNRWLEGDTVAVTRAGNRFLSIGVNRLAPELAAICPGGHRLDLEDVFLVCLRAYGHDGPHGWEQAAEALAPPTPEEQDAAAARIAARWKART